MSVLQLCIYYLLYYLAVWRDSAGVGGNQAADKATDQMKTLKTALSEARKQSGRRYAVMNSGTLYVIAAYDDKAAASSVASQLEASQPNEKFVVIDTASAA